MTKKSEFQKLTVQLKKANRECKMAFDKYQAACKYHWTNADDGWKWKKALAARDRHSDRWKKADAILKKITQMVKAGRTK